MVTLPILVLTIMFSFLAGNQINKEPSLKKYEKAVIAIYGKTTNHDIHPIGTAFFIKDNSDKLKLITNSHVCGEFNVVYSKGKDHLLTKHKVLKQSKKTDLCMLSAGYDSHPHLKLGEKAYLNTDYYAIGFPFMKFKTLQKGQIEGYDVNSVAIDASSPEKCLDLGGEFKLFMMGLFPIGRCFKDLMLYFTTIMVAPGSSGSPLIDSKGRVTGVIATGRGTPGWAGAVIFEELEEFLGE